jgi:site-specific DNA-methyltransferase (adenine-specific)
VLLPLGRGEDPWDGFRRLDVLDALRRLRPECIDLTITDPAYESLERHRAKGTTTRLAHSSASSNDWFQTISNERMAEVFRELYRVHKPATHAYIMCDDATEGVYREAARNASWWAWKALTWVKAKADGTPRAGMGYHWRNASERILFLEKRTKPGPSHTDWTVRLDPPGQGRQLNDRGLCDVLVVEPVCGYPTEKPEALVEPLVLNSSDPGERVFDPFAGSGVVAAVALRLGRRATTSDKSGASEHVVLMRLQATR